MIDVLVCLELVKWLADDIHYNSTGPNFYALHLLADRVKDFGSYSDDLKEGHWLGCLDTTPPNDKEIYELASKAYDRIVNSIQCPLGRLLDALTKLNNSIGEQKKDSSLNGGVQAILDEISKAANTYTFLVRAQAQTNVQAVQPE